MKEGLRLKDIGSTGSSWDTTQKEAWWEADIDDWVVSLRLAESRGHLVATEVRIFPDNKDLDREPGEWSHEVSEDAASIPSNILRKANVASQLRKARAAFATDADEIDWNTLERYQDLSLLNSIAIDVGFTDLSKLEKPTEHERRPGRKGHPDIYYARYALAYVRAYRDPATSHKPNAVVGKRKNESTQFVSDTIVKARRRGLLTDPPGPGQPGGELTEKAIKLLREFGEM